MAYARNGRDRRAYRRKAARLRRTNTICWLCGQPIDPTLPATHAQSWTADHVIPLHQGGHVLGELRPAHRGCNSSRNGKQQAQPATERPTSRSW